MLQIILSSILNRCRGTQWFSYIPSTALGRVLACIGLGAVNGYSHGLLCVALLSLGFLNWATYAWNVYWATAGGDTSMSAEHGIKSVNWLLDKLKIKPLTRLWGVVGMGLRQGLCALPIFAIMYYFTGNLIYLPLALVPFLFGLPYYLFNLINTSKYVTWSEYLIGAIWGAILCQ